MAASSMNRMEAPVCLIKNTEKNGKSYFEVNPAAVDLLSRFSQPVVVVSIVGLYRTGKSYLMNKLAGAKKGFSLGSTVQAETKGIWMWCIPHPTKKGHTLVLLDTEGLGDTEKGDNTNDACLFSLTVLLSSALVYNSKNAIDQDAIKKLELVGEITNFIKVKSKNKKEQHEEEDYSRHFPIFIWAVRDFYLEMKIDGNLATEDEYLENALKLKHPEKTIKDQRYNKSKECLRTYFPKRKCFVFPMPAYNGEHLQKLEEVDDQNLNPSFEDQIKTFRDYILQNVNVKSLEEMQTVTGPRLGGLVKIYTTAINSSNVACMEDAVVSLAEKENNVAIQEAIQHYEKLMTTIRLPTETLKQFLDLSRCYENEAGQIFLKKSFKDKDQKFFNRFAEMINNKKNEFLFTNEAVSKEICEGLIEVLSASFENSLMAGAYNTLGGHARFRQSIQVIEDRYRRERGKGVKAEEVLQEYMKSKQRDEIIVIQSDNALSQREKEMEAKRNNQKFEEMKRITTQLERDLEIQKYEKQRREEAFVQLEMKMEQEKRNTDKKLEQLIRQKEQEQRRMEEEIGRQNSALTAQINSLKEEQEECRTRIIPTPIPCVIL